VDHASFIHDIETGGEISSATAGSGHSEDAATSGPKPDAASSHKYRTTSATESRRRAGAPHEDPPRRTGDSRR